MPLPTFTTTLQTSINNEPIFMNLYEIEFEKQKDTKLVKYIVENCIKYELKYKSIILTLNIQQDSSISDFIKIFKNNNILKIKLHNRINEVFKIITLHNTKFTDYSFIQSWEITDCVTINIELKYSNMNEETLIY